MAKCLFCEKEAIRKIDFPSVSHSFCAFHSGIMQAFEELFQKEHTWSRIED